jgi:transposase
MGEDYDGRQYVGIDLHRRRSVIVRMTPEGERLGWVRIDNDPVALGLELAKAGPDPEVVLEATYGWYWAVDALRTVGAHVHLAHPLGVKAFSYRRVKNDVRDATDLADLLRMGRLPEAYVATAHERELRELVRHRAKLVALRSGLKAQVHATLAKQGQTPTVTDLFGRDGMRWLRTTAVDLPYRQRINSLLELIDAYDGQIELFRGVIANRLRGHRGYQVIQQISGVGPTFAAVFVAEIGDVSRFSRPQKLCCWAGLTPRHRESDTTLRRGPITKQGSTLVRWAAIEACQHTRAGTKLAADRSRIIAARGRNIGIVSAARRLLILVYYGLRDGQIRALARGAA